MKSRAILIIGICISSFLIVILVILGGLYFVNNNKKLQSLEHTNIKEDTSKKEPIKDEIKEKDDAIPSETKEEKPVKKLEELSPEETSEEINDKKEEIDAAFTYDVSNEFFQFTLPDSWRTKAIVEKIDNSILVSQKSSYEVNGGGMLFSIEFTNDKEDMESLPDYTLLKEKDGIYFYLSRPTDVQFIQERQKEYQDMEKLISKIQETFVITSTESLTKIEEIQEVNPEAIPEESGSTEKLSNSFILGNSNTSYIKEEDLKKLKKEELRLARNEIYARRGYIFKSEDLKKYFEAKSWYKGTVKASEFQDNSFNEFEKANIKMIDEFEKKL